MIIGLAIFIGLLIMIVVNLRDGKDRDALILGIIAVAVMTRLIVIS